MEEPNGTKVSVEIDELILYNSRFSSLFLIVLRINTLTVQTNCVHCGSQIKVDAKIVKGKDFLSEKLLKRDDIYPDDYYVFVHVLCEKCDFLKGFDEEANKKQRPIILTP